MKMLSKTSEQIMFLLLFHLSFLLFLVIFLLYISIATLIHFVTNKVT